jgi:hypothetical protein
MAAEYYMWITNELVQEIQEDKAILPKGWGLVKRAKATSADVLSGLYGYRCQLWRIRDEHAESTFNDKMVTITFGAIYDGDGKVSQTFIKSRIIVSRD